MSQRVRRLGLAGLAVAGLAGAGCQSTAPPGTPLISNASLFGGSTPSPTPVTTAAGPSLLSGGPLLGGNHPRLVRPAQKAPEADEASLPKELNKVTLPPYTVEAPDILQIDAQRLVPLPPYRVQPLDSLYLFLPGLNDTTAGGTPGTGNPVNGVYPIDPDGTINLGELGGAIRVDGMTIPEIQALLRKRLEANYQPKVAGTLVVSLAQAAGLQRIAGPHLVRPDGTVHLGMYGSVYVAGLSLRQVKQVIETHLSQYLYKPEVSVDVFAYNSKFYYVVTDYAGSGESVVKLPSTGNETVLDAIANVGGLSAVSSKQVWVARPGPTGCGDQILPVDWKGITRRGATQTNYQVLPGDRVFVMGQSLTKLDTTLARILAPAERVFGAALLGNTTVRSFEGNGAGVFGGNTTNVNVAR